jgi:hypothetical protein
MRITALAATKRHRDHLPSFGVVAESGRIRHADEFVFDDRLIDLERFRHHRLQFVEIGPVLDDEIFPLTESIRPTREGGAGQGHRKCAFSHLGFFHRVSPYNRYDRRKSFLRQATVMLGDIELERSLNSRRRHYCELALKIPAI